MKITDTRLRDPFVFAENGVYYLYGTRCNGPLCSAQGEGLDVYTSTDLEEWSEPVECFTRPADFWADRDFFAPEVHKWKGTYYMFASFRSLTHVRATHILKADSPMGPFVPVSDKPATPEDRVCLDGTLYVDKEGNPWIVFCHEWTQIHDGTICATRLNDDFSETIGEPVLLFNAGQNDWLWSLTDHPNDYVTDGPFFYRKKDGKLIMLWSTFENATHRYVQTYAYSENGDIMGPWKHSPKPIFNNDGGHGMVFRSFDGQLYLTLHQPNGRPFERARFFKIDEDEMFPTDF